MWNRLTHHGTQGNIKNPPLPGRNQSASVQRTTNGLAPSQAAGRPSPGDPRASALSLLSNSSDTSLVSKGGRPRTESNLRYAINSTPPPDVPDPMQVLGDVLGVDIGEKTPRAPKQFTEDGGMGLDDLDTFIDFGDLGLEDYVREKSTAEVVPPDGRSFGPPAGTHEQLQRDQDRFQDLHQSIAQCDSVLQTVEAHLAKFQTDLGLVSTEIEALQIRSSLLTAKLENRKNVEKVLGPAVEEISIAPSVVKKISEGEIDEQWANALEEVERWSKSVLEKPRDQRAKATEDMQVLAENLINRAIERIRDHLIKQVKSLRQPMANAQLIQRQKMLKTKPLYDFLLKQNAKSAEEIGQAYGNGMRWYYHHHFEKYRKALEKLNVHETDKSDLLGEEDAPKKRKDTPAHPMKSSWHFFALQRRAEVLRATNPAVPAFLTTTETSQAIYLEAPFRSFNLAILDNACSEYAFLSSYFTHLSFSALSSRFSQIFGPTFALGQSLTSHLISQSTDCLGILLCIRLNQYFALESQRRKVPVLEPYINATTLLLWPRFQKAVDAHCDSLRQAASVSSLTPRNLTSTLSSITGTSTAPSLAPHFLAQRFAHFIHGILSLTNPQASTAASLPVPQTLTPSSAGSRGSEALASPGLSSDEEPVGRSLLRLRAEFENVMNKLGRDIGDQRKRERFLVNNYGLVMTIVGDVPGAMAEEMRAWLREKGADREIS